MYSLIKNFLQITFDRSYLNFLIVTFLNFFVFFFEFISLVSIIPLIALIFENSSNIGDGLEYFLVFNV